MDYSVIIRTIGKAEEKYVQMMNSINNLEIKPVEIIVVLPKGTPIPNYKIGNERFIFSERGMVIQRLVGMEACVSRYALVTDDDILFESDFIQKVMEPVVKGGNAFSSGPLIEFFPCTIKQKVISCLMGMAVPSLFSKNKYNTVLRTTGYSYINNISKTKVDYLETQSAPWTCFFADLEKFKCISFRDELWLDKNGFASKDDITMFYKGWINGFKTIIVKDAKYHHLDAKTSVYKNNRNKIYSSGFNMYVFAYRFFFERENGMLLLWSIICLYYAYIFQRIQNYYFYITKRYNMEERDLFKKGFIEAKRWVKSDEYKMLNSVDLFGDNSE